MPHAACLDIDLSRRGFLRGVEMSLLDDLADEIDQVLQAAE
jgi:hypothetical protein